MGLSQAEIEARLKQAQDDFEAAMATKDPSKMADLYHPQAVMVHVGGGAIYGRDAIIKVFEKMLKEPSPFKILTDASYEAGNGEYLIQKGKVDFEEPDGSHRYYAFEQILKQSPGGKYLIYHDEFEM